MFAYNPTETNRAGEYYAQNQLAAAQAMAQAQMEASRINAAAMAQMGQDIGGVLSSFAGEYAENKALEAKGGAYADFMKRHGEQLGFDPNYLEDFLKKPKREQAMIGDSIIGMQNTGRNIMSQQIVGMQMAPRAATTATGTGGVMNQAPVRSKTF